MLFPTIYGRYKMYVTQNSASDKKVGPTQSFDSYEKDMIRGISDFHS